MDDQSAVASQSPTKSPTPILVINLEGVEVVFDPQSGLNRSSREQPDRTFPCRYAGCNVACKRSYERDRHEQTKHKQSKNLFCPIGRCRCSRDADELAEALSGAYFYSWKGKGRLWASMREGMKTEILEHRSNDPEYVGTHFKVRLLGFARRDKLIKHIQKAHKDIDTAAEDFAIERDALVGEPIVAELQAFWARPLSNWTFEHLGRLLRTDGRWTDWFGYYRAKIEAAGFQQWTVTGKRDYELLKKEEGYKNLLPWEASAILQQRSIALQEIVEPINHAQLEHTKTQTLNPEQDASLNRLSGDTAESSMQLWSTQASGPESLTAPYANLLVGHENEFSAFYSLADAAAIAHVSLTPGQIGGSPSTDSAPLAPIFHSGESLALNYPTTPMAAPTAPASGAAQDGSLWPEDLEYSNLVPALPTLPWADSAFGADAVADGEINFDFSEFEALQQWQQEGIGEQGVGEPGAELGDEFNCEFGEFFEVPEWQPQGSGEHGEDEPKDEALDYSGLGKRSFSQL